MTKNFKKYKFKYFRNLKLIQIIITIISEALHIGIQFEIELTLELKKNKVEEGVRVIR